ncbi:LPS export ABC transporter permease LptF [Candidatus Providencia siddallii]|uniref:Lipopolysaccharide export system permease protein LptF n=1 Tax=Candidatus Providencia siddallii TaxID=1715285 RepID=A0ABM9NPX0_9GAMM
MYINIVFRYLVRENLKSQLAVFFVLMLIFFSQKFIDIFGDVVHGDIPLNLIIPLLISAIPEMVYLMLPLSLFLGLLIRCSKFCYENEFIVMYACCFGKNIIIKAVLMLSIIISFFSICNIIWILPLSYKYQEQIIFKSKVNPLLLSIAEGQFKITKNGNFALYVDSIKNSIFKNIFFVQLRDTNIKHSSFVVANSGYIKECFDGKQIIVLNKGVRYEGIPFLSNFNITKFVNYKAIVEYKTNENYINKIEQKSMFQLWNDNTLKANSEFHWRLTVIFSIFIMALIAVPLCEVNLRQGRLVSMLPTMLLYLIFFLLHNILRNFVNKHDFNCIYITWMINFLYLILAIFLNLWNTLSFRRIRLKFIRGLFWFFLF